MDDRNRVWLLWCSSVRVSPDEVPRDHRLHDATHVDIHTQVHLSTGACMCVGL